MVTRTSKLFDVGTLPELGTLPEKMHAWTLRNERLGDPATAFREEIVPVPEPGDDEIIVANFYAGVNHNGIWAALGKPKNVINENGNFSDPHEDFHICGSEASGIVYDIGKNVTEFQIGDYVTVGAAQYDDDCPLIRAGADPVNSPTFRVWGYEGNWGSFAQFSKVMTKQCHKIPPTLNMAEAASFTAAGVAVYRMLTHWEGNRIKEGDIVLVYGGAGAVGSIAIPLVDAMGGIPVAVVSSDERGEFCESIGARGYINRKNFTHWGSIADYTDPDVQRKWLYEAMKFRKSIWKAAGVRKDPAIVIEHPGADTMPTSIFVCDNNGMVVICGATSSYWTNLDLRFLWLGQKRLQGNHSATPEDYDRFVDFIVKNNIRQPVGQVFSWDEIPLAHKLLHEDKGAAGRMVVKII